MDPFRLFCEMFKNCKFWQFTIVGGMVPLNLFSPNPSVNKYVRLPIEVGISPDNLFPLKPNTCIFWNFLIVVGMMPVKWLQYKLKIIKLTRFSNDARIVLDISLNARYKLGSWVDKLDIELGKTPTNWFVSKSNTWSLLKMLRNGSPFLGDCYLTVASKDPTDFTN